MANHKQDFGVLYGQKTTEDALLIYSSYDDAQASPQSGDFIVLTPKDEDGVKFLARVEAEIYDEDPIFRNQDKTLIAVHYARIAERELSERDKQKMFSYTYKVKILGTFEGDGKNFTTAVRKLPVVSYHARHLTQREISNILNRTNESGTKIGHLCIGETIQKDSEILFDIKKLHKKRTMVFAQSGFGKTNLMKVLIYESIKDKLFGKLIFDLNGEYFLRSVEAKTYGFGDIENDIIKSNLVIYTDKQIPDFYKDKLEIAGKVNVNFAKDFTINDIFQTSLGITNAGKTFLEYLDGGNPEDVKEFLSKVLSSNDTSEIRKFAYTKFSSYFETSKKQAKDTGDKDIEKEVSQANKAMLGAVIRQIRSYASINDNNSNLVEQILRHLKNNKTVIIDLSLKDSQDASLISTALVRRIFSDNKQFFTSGNENDVINAIVVVEEAQNVLSDEFVRSNANPFVRVAKEGRKFGLGLVAITQRPSAISEEIRSQAENFFVLHMGNSKDIKALVESNINYGGVISKFVQSETIPGNLYMVSANQSFALPVRVIEFEELVKNKVYEDLKLKK